MSNVTVIEKLTFFDHKVRPVVMPRPYSVPILKRACAPRTGCRLCMRLLHAQDANGKDWGLNVRQRAKELVALINDPERMRAERHKASSSSPCAHAGLGCFLHGANAQSFLQVGSGIFPAVLKCMQITSRWRQLSLYLPDQAKANETKYTGVSSKDVRSGGFGHKSGGLSSSSASFGSSMSGGKYRSGGGLGSSGLGSGSSRAGASLYDDYDEPYAGRGADKVWALEDA